MARTKRRFQKPAFDPTLSRGILAIVFCMIAVIITLSFFGRAGALGIAVNEYILASLFGSMRYAMPAALLIIAWYLIRDIKYTYRATHGIGVLLFLLAASSLFHLRFEPALMWSEAVAGGGGGIFGMAAYPLKTYIGMAGSIIMLSAATLISLLLVFNTSLSAFILLHQKILAVLGIALRTIFDAVRTRFFRKPDMPVRGAYRTTDTREDGEEADEYSARRIFSPRAVGAHGEESVEKTAEAAEDADEEDVEEVVDAKGPWTKKIVIRNLPSLSLLSDKRGKPTSGDIKSNAQTIKETLKEFGINVDIGEIRVGPAVTQYAVRPEQGVKLSRITALIDNLALALAAHPIRIEAPIPGKSLVGIEVPNQKTALVGFKELLESKEFESRPHRMMIALGKDVAGKVWWADLPKMPHLLIAGATGSGKTVCVNTVIMSLLFQNTAETLRFIMVDPKRVELTVYNGIPHLLTPVITNVQKTVNALKWTIQEMERRFEALENAGNRDIHSYNAKHPGSRMPHIVFIIDELADLMAAAASEVEAGIIRLAQMARAVGIHLLVATQRPSVDVITGLMKANIPARVAFSVASLVDSRTILDSSGAEKLLGRGDMLFQTPELSKPVRIQGAFISEEELKSVVEYLRGDDAPEYDASIVEKSSGGTMNMFGGAADDQDPLFQEAKTAILQAGKASASFLQRKLKIGYARAARLLDELEAAGIIGPGEGAKPREILASARAMDAGGKLNVFDAGVESEEEETVTEDGEIAEEDEEEDGDNRV